MTAIAIIAATLVVAWILYPSHPTCPKCYRSTLAEIQPDVRRCRSCGHVSWTEGRKLG